LRGLLLDCRLPLDAQFAALAAVLRSLDDEDPLVEELLRTLASGRGKAKSIERLRQFEQYAGPHPVIDELCEQLEGRLRLSCPRCGVELRRPRMVRHLWDEHRLVLDGRRAREPWSLIEDWVEEYRERREPDLLDRGRDLAQRFDAKEGVRRFHRLLLTRGFADEEARRDLMEEATQKHAACCPWCYALVPVPREVRPVRLNLYRGRLSGGGYRVEVSEDRLFTLLEIVTPVKRIYRGRERGRLLTQRGAMSCFVAPFVLLSLLWACAAPASSSPAAVWTGPLLPVLVILFLAQVIHLITRRMWRPLVPAAVRVRNYAWTMLAPRLHADGFSLDDSAFLAGLALLSGGDGFEPLRTTLMPDLVKRTENALTMAVAPPGHLAALRRLMIEDAVSRGADPVPLVVDHVARCLEGRFSLRFAEHLLAGWESNWWTPGNKVRLRALLCDRAFEIGFEVRNLLDAGQNAPALGRALGIDNVSNLAALRLLWSLRPTRPWDRCGDPLTVFDLAADPNRSEMLGNHPDLLLWQVEPDWHVAAPGQTDPKPAQIVFCLRGMILQGTLFTEKPRVVEVNARWRYNDLVINEQRFRSSGSLDMLALRMERWFRYSFSEFLTALPQVEKWRPPDRQAILRAWGAVTCPECHHQLLPQVAQIGIALEKD
jgi:hypothetical protein